MKEKFKKEYLKAKAPRLIFYRSPQSNLSRTDKNVISNLKIQGSRLERPNQIKLS